MGGGVKLELTPEQWTAMLPAISEIDGGCTSCIISFLMELGGKFVINKGMLEEVYCCFNSKLDAEDVERIIRAWV